MSAALRKQLYTAAVGLRPRPASVPTLLLPSWRVPVVALLIGACRGRKAKREQLIVLNWAIRDSGTYEAVRARLAGEPGEQPAAVRYEPALVRAANIASGLGLLCRDGESLSLTEAGKGLVEAIAKQGLYAHERELLDALPKALPVNAAQALLAGGL